MAHWTAICSLTAAGNFHAGQAFLPSSSVMILWRLSAANQLRDNHAFAIFWGLLAVLSVGWPFCAVLFLSTGFWALWKASGLGGGGGRRFRLDSVVRVLLRTALHAIIIQALVMATDYYFYGRMVSPIWNIFVYNARSGGDELYGVEPLSYYIKNLLLNFNLVSLLGFASLPAILSRKLAERFYPDRLQGNDDKSIKRDNLEILVLAPMYAWMAIVLPRPHKEERFLFPIYPILCFGTAVTLRETLHLCSKVLSFLRGSKEGMQNQRRDVNLLLGLALLSPSAVISILRSIALHHHYSAPLEIYSNFFAHAATTTSPALPGSETTHVCTAGEWYRFPSSFFLPPNHQLGFLKSSFAGQLPQPYSTLGSKWESLSSDGAGNFNDANKEEMDRYVNIEQCSFVIELVPLEMENVSDVPECVQYMESDSSPGSWKKLASHYYLDADSTPALHRILYLPLGRNGKVAFKTYNLYGKDSSRIEAF
eukprot:CAMPEP_0172563432 /NCGR_PEP_ID=MMETSP1067-20121228/100647_1 /TAXON_ID=265564 ORGANISM="Thalassiosira punctigera, Strain Tpunct2005C2" /NCGR_SAMPLE_ID=MMETSP1067 /ASSEMBLY_ACC=CAM_ASM_000444 /LENGTH=479 /DNA_ID=CAMNT_0013353879 /DNA_START=518 /DNA_END=1957 /DNA_ORIENTATION=+